jgi:hypothetical protein
MAHAFRSPNRRRTDSIAVMDSQAFGPRSSTERNLTVTHREAIALLSALELSPFVDEVLEQKLLNLVYSIQDPSHRGHPTRNRDFTHHRRQVG